jgi:hypothetical protein
VTWTRGWIEGDQQCDRCLGTIHKDDKGWRSPERGGIFLHDDCYDELQAENRFADQKIK